MCLYTNKCVCISYYLKVCKGVCIRSEVERFECYIVFLSMILEMVYFWHVWRGKYIKWQSPYLSLICCYVSFLLLIMILDLDMFDVKNTLDGNSFSWAWFIAMFHLCCWLWCHSAMVLCKELSLGMVGVGNWS